MERLERHLTNEEELEELGSGSHHKHYRIGETQSGKKLAIRQSIEVILYILWNNIVRILQGL